MVTRLKLSNNNNSVSCTATKGRDFFFLLDSRSLKRSPSSLTWSVFDPLFAYSYSLFTPPTHLVCTVAGLGAPAPLSYSLLLSHLKRPPQSQFIPSFALFKARVRADMLRAFVFFALHSLSALASSSGQQSLPLFIGCVGASSSLGFHGPTGAGARDLDPVACSAHCLDEG